MYTGVIASGQVEGFGGQRSSTNSPKLFLRRVCFRYDGMRSNATKPTTDTSLVSHTICNPQDITHSTFQCKAPTSLTAQEQSPAHSKTFLEVHGNAEGKFAVANIAPRTNDFEIATAFDVSAGSTSA